MRRCVSDCCSLSRSNASHLLVFPETQGIDFHLKAGWVGAKFVVFQANGECFTCTPKKVFPPRATLGRQWQCSIQATNWKQWVHRMTGRQRKRCLLRVRVQQLPCYNYFYWQWICCRFVCSLVRKEEKLIFKHKKLCFMMMLIDSNSLCLQLFTLGGGGVIYKMRWTYIWGRNASSRRFPL